MTVWRTSNNGRSWEPCEVSDRGAVALELSRHPDAQWGDGMGNIYRRNKP